MVEEEVRVSLMRWGKWQRRLLLRIHRLIPASQVFQIGQSGLAVEQVVAEHAVQIVIHE